MNGALLSTPVYAGDDDAAPPFPFGKLPEELASDIFINACGQNGKLPDTTHDCLRLTLQLVSKSWRQLVVGMQNLWNDLYLDLLDFDSPDLDSLIRRAESWLKYARGLDISLKLTTFCCSVQSRKAITSFLSTYHFKLLAIQSFPSQVTLMDLDESIKNLLETVISLSLVLTWFHLLPSPLFSHRLPLSSLKYLTINNIEIDSTYGNLSDAFPWDQLLRVNLHRFKWVASATEILRRCRSLIDCKITVMDESNSILAEEVESHVQHLFIKGKGALQVAWSMNAPKLESLNVCSFDTAKVLARQSKDRLRCFVLQNFQCIDLREVLEFMPSLLAVKIAKVLRL